jgi:hypothetical protein
MAKSEIEVRVRAQGTCRHCKSWASETHHCQNSIVNPHGNLRFNRNFGCIHWQDSKEPTENYQSSTVRDRILDVLKRENDCAADEIVRLSKMIVDLGFDPTVNHVSDSEVESIIKSFPVGVEPERLSFSCIHQAGIPTPKDGDEMTVHGIKLRIVGVESTPVFDEFHRDTFPGMSITAERID